jgi:glucose/arabinose dehydrogenase
MRGLPEVGFSLLLICRTGGHWHGKQSGAFIAFHGGFDRAPFPNEGFNVMFVPMGSNGTPSGAPEIFADGFAGPGGPLPGAALHRPVGVTEGHDGSLYVSDDRGGRIYRIVFVGN